MGDSTLHGITESGQEIRRHARYGWYISGGNLVPMEEVTVRRAAIEALRGGHVILGMQGGKIFDRTVRQLGSDPDFGEPTGLTAWDAAEIFWRNAIGPAELLLLDHCWVAGFSESTGDPATIHVDRETGLVHDPKSCAHV